MLSLLTFPSPADIIGTTSTGATLWATSWLVEFWPLIYISVGLMVMALLIRFVIGSLKQGIAHTFSVSPEERQAKKDEMEYVAWSKNHGLWR